MAHGGNAGVRPPVPTRTPIRTTGIDHAEWRRHPELLSVMAGFRIMAAFECAQAEARRVRGSTACLNMQADLTAYLTKKLSGSRAPIRAAE